MVTHHLQSIKDQVILPPISYLPPSSPPQLRVSHQVLQQACRSIQQPVVMVSTTEGLQTKQIYLTNFGTRSVGAEIVIKNEDSFKITTVLLILRADM